MGYYRSQSWVQRREQVERGRAAVRVLPLSTCANVHHRTYASFGREPLEDLMGVCRICHTRIHRIGGTDGFAMQDASLADLGDPGTGTRPCWRAYLRESHEGRGMAETLTPPPILHPIAEPPSGLTPRVWARYFAALQSQVMAGGGGTEGPPGPPGRTGRARASGAPRAGGRSRPDRRHGSHRPTRPGRPPGRPPVPRVRQAPRAVRDRRGSDATLARP